MSPTRPSGSTRRARHALLIAGIAVVAAAAGCTAPPAGYAPRGSLDMARGVVEAETGVWVAGWVDDQDAQGPANVKVTIDGNLANVSAATNDRPDVAAAVPGAKVRSGFQVFVSTSPGLHRVCVWAANTGGTEQDLFLGCRDVGVGYTLIVPPVNGVPVHWRGCQVISYDTRTATAYPEARQDIDAALAAITAKTGLQFQFNQEVATIPSREYGGGSGPVPPLLIGWVTAAESNLFWGAPNSVVGVAGSWYTGTNYVTGRVALEKDRLASMPRTGPSSRMTVLLHELGHAIGLGHVDDGSQIMNPYVPNLSTWGAGDVLGLQAVSPAGCAASRSAAPEAPGELQAGPLVMN